LLERHGLVTRELVRAEGIAGGFAALYPAFTALETIGAARRGYFIEGLGGAQFALPGAVERLRAPESDEARAVVLSTADPAQLYGAALPWPEAGAGGAHGPARRPGACVVLVGGLPVVSVEAGGHSLRVHDDRDPVAVAHALAALAAAVREGQVARLAIERIDGEPAIDSLRRHALLDLGFRASPRRLTLSRGDA
jgi:ATP-dependent Lhr-like helicase